MRKFFPIKHPQFIISLRFGILAVFSVLFLVLITTLVSIFYFHISGIVDRASFLLMSEASIAALNEFNLELLPIESLTIFTTKNIRQDIFDVKNQQIIIAYMVHLLKGNPLAQGTFWGDVNGNFVYVKKAADKKFTAEIINHSLDSVTDKFINLTAMHQEINSYTQPVNFDPRSTVWFRYAAQEKRAIWTDFFLQTKTLQGLAVAAPAINDNGVFLGVFGIQVSLEALSHYVAQQKITKNSEFYILDPRGKIIASSDSKNNLTNIKMISLPAAKSFSLYKEDATDNFKFTWQDMNYLVSYKKIPLLSDSGWLIGIIIPEVDFIKKIHHLEDLYILINILIFLCGLFVMSKLVNRITEPIEGLVIEASRIKNFHLDQTPPINSHIREIINISQAIEDMKTGLRSFKRYVPASLVRKLIYTGTGVDVGSEKKSLAIFFSDIQNFTTIAENESSDTLTQQICAYFEEVSRVIIRNRGTIDKYIGDSVMAFWGAPIAVVDPCHDAARAAFHIHNKLNQLNVAWSQAGLPPFYTRMGIHYGEAIVGNIGSSERLNYTVLGDTVNIASRLVDVNKIYGTSILVSEEVHAMVKASFVLRFVDYVTLKGKAQVTALYELLAVHKQDLSFDLDQYRQAFDQAFQAYLDAAWSNAIHYFEEALKIYPKDTLAHVFIARATRFTEVGTPDHWDGIWRIN